MKSDLYQTITDKVIAYLDEVIASGEQWDRPYVPAPQAQPMNRNGRAYSGTNWLLLAISNAPSGCWDTYKGWTRCGAQVRKGEKGTMVIYMAPVVGRPKANDTTADDDAKPGKRTMILRSYVVFSAEQVDGFDLVAWQAKRGRVVPVLVNGATIDSATETALQLAHSRMGVGLGEHGGPPCYIPSMDMIRMPPMKAFKTAAGRYSTWAHELAHATGAKTRLDRNLTVRFGSEAYAVEELVAELAAAMVCGALGVSTEARKDHACYIAAWLKVLKSDKRAVVTAARKAQDAANMVVGESEAEEMAEAA